MTAKELRHVLNALPDDTLVLVCDNDNGLCHHIIVERDDVRPASTRGAYALPGHWDEHDANKPTRLALVVR